MDLEEAIKTALTYETKILNLYRQAEQQATDEPGKRVFRVLAEEEKSHVDYLKGRLEEWQQNGKLEPGKLDTAIPSPERIDAGVARLREHVEPRETKYIVEAEMLRQALQAEVETSEFYKQMVRELDSEGRQLFERFVEIEEGHQAIVQAELDCVNGLGFWFDSMEFNLEGA